MEGVIGRQHLLEKYVPIVRQFFTGQKRPASKEDLDKFIPVDPYILYVHIPFCAEICRDCTYSRDSKLEDIEEYCDYLVKEIDLLGSVASSETPKPVALYIGGGTPSLLSSSTLKRIIEPLKRNFYRDHAPEISLEVNPSSFDPGKLDAYRDLGINRISLGVQSFHEGPLKEMGRTYTVDAAREALRVLAKAGWNFNIDLIFGFDDQTPQMFYDDVQYAIENGVSHIATYNLLRKMGQEEKEQELEAQSKMYYHVRTIFQKAGWIQYFVNEFARDEGAICKYTNERLTLPRKENMCFGTAGDGGTVPGGIYQKFRGRKKYMQTIGEGVYPAFFLKSEDPHIPLTIHLMDMLRSMTKLDTAMFKNQFGVDPREVPFVKDLEEQGFITIEDKAHSKEISVKEDHLFQYNAFYNDIRYFDRI